jgi:hypothetical protein
MGSDMKNNAIKIWCIKTFKLPFIGSRCMNHESDNVFGRNHHLWDVGFPTYLRWVCVSWVGFMTKLVGLVAKGVDAS